MRDKIQEIVVQAVVGTKNITEAIDQLWVLSSVNDSLIVDRTTRKGHPQSHYECPHCQEDYSVEMSDQFCRKCGGKIHWNQ